jgi:hypothetical protein
MIEAHLHPISQERRIVGAHVEHTPQLKRLPVGRSPTGRSQVPPKAPPRIRCAGPWFRIGIGHDLGCHKTCRLKVFYHGDSAPDDSLSFGRRRTLPVSIGPPQL